MVAGWSHCSESLNHSGDTAKGGNVNGNSYPASLFP